MTHNCSREHDRELERHNINGDVDVYDSLRNLYIGRLVNIHAQGLMIVGDVQLEEDHLYTVDLHMPGLINGQKVIQLGVDCLWARDADLSGKHWTGFAIIDVAPASADSIRQLVQQLGELP